MNGLLLELGFLKRLRQSPFWPRIAVFFGTSAGAVNSCLAALDRLDDLEEFILTLQPEDTFRAHRLWRLPLLGTHDYVLPRTIAERLEEPVEIAEQLARAPVEVVVIVTDVTVDEPSADVRGTRLFELAYSSRTTSPPVLAEAVLASAAISALVLPIPVGDRIGTDGGWVRNFPLGYAYERPEVEQIVAFRYRARYPAMGLGPLRNVIDRLRRYSKLPAARALLAELEEAARREERGQPAHIVDTFSRLTRVAIMRNTQLEELVADWRDASVTELASLRADIAALIAGSRLRGKERERLAREIEERFEQASFPFRQDRHIPRITVSGTAARELALEPGYRNPRPWSVESKRALIEYGWQLTDDALARAGESAATGSGS